MTTYTSMTAFAALAWALLLALGGCTDTPSVGSTGAALTVACAAPAEIPADAWTCPDARTVECDALPGTTLYVAEGDDLSCDGPALQIAGGGDYAPGSTYTVTVQSGVDPAVCEAELTVVDHTPPALQAHTISLWPPNHKLHAIDVADCVSATDACDGELRGEFIWASSDEPVDDIGDGHHAPDIVLSDDCERVSVRAERQGPKEGRVYTLAVRVTDRAGNSAQAECQVIVDHDQRGVVGVDSGEAYRITFDGSDGGPVCDGIPDDAGTPDVDAGTDPTGDAPQ